ncbi:MAG: intradiol ring-cleavage dioxygenase [Nevskia sp.]|nr:intradiol ring-cleavage dioxygenase [Nevskia sp.]
MNQATLKSVFLSRRSALGVLGGAITGLTFVGCGGSEDSTDATTTTGTTTGSTTTSGACALTPEGEIGPYFTDDSAAAYQRSNILSSIDGTNQQSGIPLTLHVYVYDFDNNCAAVAGSQVDIWHCNAAGVYSNESSESTIGQTWLRGYQITDASGAVSFTTIIPGWYQGRTTHIHLRVRSSYSEASSTSDGTNTTQLFFPQTLIDTIDTTIAPYSSEGKNSTTNANDHVYTPETEGKTELVLAGDSTNGYVATIVIGLPITAA